jgi:hypothetical protein
MADDRWEYCELILFKAKNTRGGQAYELGIRYFGQGSHMLSQVKGPLARDWKYNPWEKSIALLGEAGWQLVSVQHANSAGDMGGGGEIDHNNAVAYFKRPSESGRRIDDPELALP